MEEISNSISWILTFLSCTIIDRFDLAGVLSLCNTRATLCAHWKRPTVAKSTFKEGCPSYTQMSRPLWSRDDGNGTEDFADILPKEQKNRELARI